MQKENMPENKEAAIVLAWRPFRHENRLPASLNARHHSGISS
jgi:hypothetical protein